MSLCLHFVPLHPNKSRFGLLLFLATMVVEASQSLQRSALTTPFRRYPPASLTLQDFSLTRPSIAKNHPSNHAQIFIGHNDEFAVKLLTFKMNKTICVCGLQQLRVERVRAKFYQGEKVQYAYLLHNGLLAAA